MSTALANPPEPPRRRESPHVRPVYAQTLMDLGSLGVRPVRMAYVIEAGELHIDAVQICQHEAMAHDDQFWHEADWLLDFVTQDQELALYETCRRDYGQRQIARLRHG